MGAVTGALIGTKVTNASGTATQPFTFTLPGNYTIVANVSQQDTSQYGLAATTTQAYVLDQTTITLTATQAAAGAATVSVRTHSHNALSPSLAPTPPGPEAEHGCARL